MTAVSPARRVLFLFLSLALALAGTVGLGATAHAAEGPVVTPTIAAQSADGLTIEVEGAGFSTEGPGVYVSFREDGGATDIEMLYVGTSGAAEADLPMSEEGSFTASLTMGAAQIADLDPDSTYVIFTRKAHGQAAADPSQTTTTPVALDFDSLQPSDEDESDESTGDEDGAGGEDSKDSGGGAVDEGFETYTPISFEDDEPDEPTGARTTATIAEQSADSLTIEVEGAGFDPVFPGVYVAFGETGTTETQNSDAYVETNYVSNSAIDAEGAFRTVLELDAEQVAGLDPDLSYSVITFKAHGMPDPGGTQTTDSPVGLDFELLQPDEPEGARTTTKILAQTKNSLRIEVKGADFDTVFPGLYVSLGETGTTDSTNADAYAATNFVTNFDIAPNGSFTTVLDLDAKGVAGLDPDLNYSIITVKAHGMPDPGGTQTTDTPIKLDFAKLQPGGSGGGGGGGDDSGPGGGNGGQTTPPAAQTKAGAGYLEWAISSQFRRYATGPIARGSVSVTGGAGAAGNAYRWPQTASNARSDGRGTTSYSGAVTFSGHGGVLALSVRNPVVTVESASRGSVAATVGGRRVTIATLDLARAQRSTTADGVRIFRNAPARWTAAGSSGLFGDFGNQPGYGPGASADPVTFAIGSNVAAGSVGGGAQTVAAATSAAAATPPDAPPATTGLSELSGVDLDHVKPGQKLTVSGNGFEPDETDIEVVVYSDPIVVEENLQADASGVATWEGTVPMSLEPGEHTLTFQGSVDGGLSFTVVDETFGVCEVTGGTVAWGFKESFRSYLSSTMANGNWSTSGDIDYETPEFLFHAGTGHFDASDQSGQLDFGGALDFTGHDGALTITLTDPSIRFVDAETALLVVDVSATEREAAEAGGSEVEEATDVSFVELDLSAAPLSETDAVWTAEDVPTTLTTEGHTVFTSYEAGDAFDPMSLSFSVADDCATEAAQDEDAVAASADAGGSGDDSTTWWPWALAGSVILAAGLGLGGGFLIARGKAA